MYAVADKFYKGLAFLESDLSASDSLIANVCAVSRIGSDGENACLVGSLNVAVVRGVYYEYSFLTVGKIVGGDGVVIEYERNKATDGIVVDP